MGDEKAGGRSRGEGRDGVRRSLLSAEALAQADGVGGSE